MVPEIIRVILLIVQIILFLYLSLTSLYFLVYSIAGLFRVRPVNRSETKNNRFAILIPGYMEDAVIIDVAKQALDQDYPSSCYRVVIIADSFASRTLEELRKLPIEVIEIFFENRSKAKALAHTMNTIQGPFDAVVILDADNIMGRDVLQKFNDYLNSGYKAIQAHRTGKNQNTAFAVLDTISEEINNHIFRRGHSVLGLSSALIGSGMAFDFELFKNYITSGDFFFGEDKA